MPVPIPHDPLVIRDDHAEYLLAQANERVHTLSRDLEALTGEVRTRARAAGLETFQKGPLQLVAELANLITQWKKAEQDATKFWSGRYETVTGELQVRIDDLEQLVDFAYTQASDEQVRCLDAKAVELGIDII